MSKFVDYFLKKSRLSLKIVEFLIWETSEKRKKNIVLDRLQRKTRSYNDF